MKIHKSPEETEYENFMCKSTVFLLLFYPSSFPFRCLRDHLNYSVLRRPQRKTWHSNLSPTFSTMQDFITTHRVRSQWVLRATCVLQELLNSFHTWQCSCHHDGSYIAFINGFVLYIQLILHEQKNGNNKWNWVLVLFINSCQKFQWFSLFE